MTEKPYENREIDSMLKEVHSKLDLILAQTTKHNGRLTTLEKWMWTMSGAIVIMGFLLGNNFLNVFK